MSTIGPTPLRIFLSHSADDDIRYVYSSLAEAGYEVSSWGRLHGAMPITEALVRSIQSADVVLAWLDASSPNVLLEVGIGLGAGKPVIGITGRTRPPLRDLAGLQTVTTDTDLGLLDLAIRRAASTARDEVEWIQASGPALDEVRVESFVNAPIEALSGAGFTSMVRDLFNAVQCKVIEPPPWQSLSPVARPDLVIWHDDLLTGFGLPMCVEVLVRVATPAALLNRLRRTLEFSGTRSLLAVNRNDMKPLYWADEEAHLVLVVSFQRLVGALAAMPLAEALGALRAEAALIGNLK